MEERGSPGFGSQRHGYIFSIWDFPIKNGWEPRMISLLETALDIINTVVREKLVSSLQHAGDLGIELYKAELALRYRRKYVQDEDCFCMTYGDGLADIDVAALIGFHRSHGRQATVTAVKPPARFGALELEGDRVSGFTEKPPGDDGLINGGFFVLHPDCLDLIDGDDCRWEDVPLQMLAESDELRAYLHDGFWQPMDTVRERDLLIELWRSGDAPWRVW